MCIEKTIALLALFVLSSATVAHADVDVWAVIDNQTSASVSLAGSGTSGTFTVTPPVSLAANTTGGAAAFTTATLEDGYLQYGPCIFIWNVLVNNMIIDTNTSSHGTGCAAIIVSEILFGPNQAWVVIEFTIT